MSFEGSGLAEIDDTGGMNRTRNARHEDSETTRQEAVPETNVARIDDEKAKEIKNPGQTYNFDDAKNFCEEKRIDEPKGNDSTPEDDNEYWRLSFMFHWLKAIGGNVGDAHEEFERYKGRASYEEFGLEHPIPLQQDDGVEHGWSHMSDYDDMGWSPVDADERRHLGCPNTEDSHQCKRCDDSRFRTDVSYDDDDETPVSKQRVEHSVQGIERKEQTYKVNGWCDEKDDPTIVCFTRGGRAVARGRQYDEDSEEGEHE